MLSLGLRDSLADGVICIAALHHLSTEQRRIIALQGILFYFMSDPYDYLSMVLFVLPHYIICLQSRDEL